ENTALFSLIGTTYGGNGQTTFGLPDLRGRVMVHTGQGPGTSNYTLGQVGGSETVTLTQNQLPSHSHNLVVAKGPASESDGTGAYLAGGGSLRAGVLTNGTTTLAPQTVAPAGGNQPFTIVQPYTTLRACINLQGIFPSRP